MLDVSGWHSLKNFDIKRLEIFCQDFCTIWYRYGTILIWNIFSFIALVWRFYLYSNISTKLKQNNNNFIYFSCKPLKTQCLIPLLICPRISLDVHLSHRYRRHKALTQWKWPRYILVECSCFVCWGLFGHAFC
jgi:hypothetical protein